MEGRRVLGSPRGARAEIDPKACGCFRLYEFEAIDGRRICKILRIYRELPLTLNNLWVLLYRACLVLWPCLQTLGFSITKGGFNPPFILFLSGNYVSDFRVEGSQTSLVPTAVFALTLGICSLGYSFGKHVLFIRTAIPAWDRQSNRSHFAAGGGANYTETRYPPRGSAARRVLPLG